MTNSEWIRDHWRPAMAIQYIFICFFDFFVAPILWTIAHIYIGDPLVMWQPLTLGTGGLYHMAMGAVLGVAAWTRGQEKTERERSRNYGRYREPQDDYGPPDPVRRTSRYDNE